MVDEIKEFETKVCSCCGREKSIKEFDVHKVDYDRDVVYYRSMCKECQSEIIRNRVRIRQQIREWNEKLAKEEVAEIPVDTLKVLKNIKSSRILGMRGKEIFLLHKDEIFVKVQKYDDYYISNYGRVISKQRGEYKLLEGHITSHGYMSYKLLRTVEKSRNHKKEIVDEMWEVTAHQLVAIHFLNNYQPDIKIHVHHKDGDKLNNDFRNLRWVSPREHKLIHTIDKIGIYDRENKCVVEYKTPYDVAENYGLSMEQLADVIHRDNETAEFEDWKRYILYRKNESVLIAIQRDKENKRKYY